MGVGRRMKKQGPPATLEELGINLKRKAPEPDNKSSSKKRRRADAKPVPAQAKVLVDLDRAIRKDKPAKKTKLKLANKDAQITVPPPMVQMSTEGDEYDNEEDDDEVPAVVSLNEISLSDIDDDDLAAADLDDAISEDSVFDSDQDDQPRAMFSEDEDESDAEAKLTAANIEGLSRKLDEEHAKIEEEAQEELQDDALQTNIAIDDGILDSAVHTGLAPDLALIRTRITETVRILGNFSELADKSRSRTDYTNQLLADICTYYGYTPYLAEKLFSLFSPAEAFAFFEANETPRPIVLRTNSLRTNRRTLAQSLINRGVVLEPVGKWSKVGLQVFESPVPLGATPEYLAGHYILQAASSFLPVMALAPQPHERVLDMAAAPGGKSTYISALMRNTGAVFANDANRQRAKGLIGNIHRLGCKNTIVCHYDAQKAFPKILGGFDRVLLDAPCSGTGVIGKDPSVKTSKTERDFLALPHLQKQLLLAAVDSVDHASKTGGYIVYSTCSVTVEENEQVVQYILRKRPNVKIVDTGLGNFGAEGFRSYMNKHFDEKMRLTRRYFPHRENVDGFFVCKLKKIGPTSKDAPKDKLDDEPVSRMEAGIEVNGTANGTTEDDFGGFDDEADQAVIQRAEQKWRRSRGLDPRAAGYKEDKRSSKTTDGENKAGKETGKILKGQPQPGSQSTHVKEPKATKQFKEAARLDGRAVKAQTNGLNRKGKKVKAIE